MQASKEHKKLIALELNQSFWKSLFFSLIGRAKGEGLWELQNYSQASTQMWRKL